MYRPRCECGSRGPTIPALRPVSTRYGDVCFPDACAACGGTRWRKVPLAEASLRWPYLLEEAHWKRELLEEERQKRIERNKGRRRAVGRKERRDDADQALDREHLLELGRRGLLAH